MLRVVKLPDKKPELHSINCIFRVLLYLLIMFWCETWPCIISWWLYFSPLIHNNSWNI